jgi:hypothetical protein
MWSRLQHDRKGGNKPLSSWCRNQSKRAALPWVQRQTLSGGRLQGAAADLGAAVLLGIPLPAATASPGNAAKTGSPSLFALAMST